MVMNKASYAFTLLSNLERTLVIISLGHPFSELSSRETQLSRPHNGT